MRAARAARIGARAGRLSRAWDPDSNGRLVFCFLIYLFLGGPTIASVFLLVSL